MSKSDNPRPSIYLTPPVERVRDKAKGLGQSLSNRLSQICERYELLLDSAQTLTDEEQQIVQALAGGKPVPAVQIRYLDSEIARVANDTAHERLSAKIAQMSMGERIAMLESLGL